ncbi:hypothetical protein DNTS_018305 [Danionella cerebrum]|uniref:Guanylate kinase-like domain-containing protein n=1 Tax=Danionella cerebrum TaxID=2873325 RepID=A0A553QEQ4_9TELE|nr:hypothetical protein DNTS_018305 [Danionella translucida]
MLKAEPSQEDKLEDHEELWERVEGVRHKLTRILNPARLTPYLRQCKVIDEQDEDEVLNSSRYPIRGGYWTSSGGAASGASRPSWSPWSFTIQTNEEGPEGLTQFLLLELRKLREQLHCSRVCERRLSQRCRVAEEERSRAERRVQEMRQEHCQLERQRQDWESGSRELGLLKERHLEQVVKYSRALEEQRKSASRERELLAEVEELKKRLVEADNTAGSDSTSLQVHHHHHQREQVCDSTSSGMEEKKAVALMNRTQTSGKQALLDILKQDRREAQEQRQELSSTIARLQGELESSETQRDKLSSQCQQLQSRLMTLQRDWETEQSRSVSYFNQILELERERDQALHSRDALQLEFTDCLLDKNRLRKRVSELQNTIEQLQKEEERRIETSSGCMHYDCQIVLLLCVFQSHVSLFSEELCFGPCCSADLSPSLLSLRARPKCASSAGICEPSEGECFLLWEIIRWRFGTGVSVTLRGCPREVYFIERLEWREGTETHSCCSISEENLFSLECNTEKDINRLSTFPFPPCANSIQRRANVEFDLNSWGSEENEPSAGLSSPTPSSPLSPVSNSGFVPQSQIPAALLCLCPLLQMFSAWPSNHQPPPPHPVASRVFPFGLKPLEVGTSRTLTLMDFAPSTSSSSSLKALTLAEDVSIIGGNRTGVFVHAVKKGSPAERCGLKEGTQLLQLEQGTLGEGSISLSQCTAEVVHFSLQWWTEADALKHTQNPEGYTRLLAELSSPLFTGADSFFVRVNLDLVSHGDPPCLPLQCDDVLHVTDTRYNGKYQWRCVRLNVETGEPLQAGAVPNYNRAQQLLLVRLRTMALEQNKGRRKFIRKPPERVRLIKAVASSYRAIGSSSPVLYTLSNRKPRPSSQLANRKSFCELTLGSAQFLSGLCAGHEEQLVPFSLVQKVCVSSRRPVIISPSLLSRAIIERLLQPADSGLEFNTCQPELLETSERPDKGMFLLESSDPQMGIRLQSIQEVINQDKHCLLRLELNHVEPLLKHGIYPIIVYIKLRERKLRRFRKLLSGHSEEDLVEASQMEELQLETLPLMFSTLQPSDWSCTDELICLVRSTILSQQRALVWLEQERIS